MCQVCETGEYDAMKFSKLCEAHDVCVDCGVKRKDLEQSPWFSFKGAFQCKPCKEKERASRIAKRQESEIDHEYTDEVVCPHCGYEFSDSWEMSESDDAVDCPDCNEVFSMERRIEVTYVTMKPRIKDTPHDTK